MTNDREFVELFAQALAEAGAARYRTPVGLVESYEGLVGQIERGYDWDWYEYRDDVTVRDFVERVLADPRLRDVPQMGWVRARVAAADERFRAVLLDEPVSAGPWWRARVPRLAGPELAADVLASHGIRVEVIDL